MKTLIWILSAAAVAGGLASGCATAPNQSSSAAAAAAFVPPRMTFSKARQQLQDSLAKADRFCIERGKDWEVQHPIVLNLTPRTLQLSYQGTHYVQTSPTFALRDLNYVTIRHYTTMNGGFWNPQYWVELPPAYVGWNTTRPVELAQNAADALNALICRAKGADAEKRAADFAAFQKQAASWHSQSPKSPLPGEADRQRILAEAAIKEKNFGKALEHYKAGLAAESLWPEGQFNAGILCGELEEYEEAADHFHRYLELVPDAPDGKMVREKMIIWEDKGKQ
jgi:tetratricopeptide (TPR) repeat protein